MREIDIKFNVPPYVDKAADYIQECVKNQKICGECLDRGEDRSRKMSADDLLHPCDRTGSTFV